MFTNNNTIWKNSDALQNKIAFIIPIYPPHFTYAKNIITSFRLNNLTEQADLWFIFTNEKEQADFGNYKNSIVLPEELRSYNNSGMITIKKFYGLFQIKNKYEYIIVLDAEVLFVRNIDLEKVCNDFFYAKNLYGNKQSPEGIKLVEPIKNNCKLFFIDNANLNKINDELYLWFNQLCIYKTSTLDDFFEIINYKENAAKFTWYQFDYYIYMYYLILYHNFQTVDIEIKAFVGVCEASLEELVFNSNKYEEIPIHMCSLSTFPKFNNPSLFIICHLDRFNGQILTAVNNKTYNLSHEINKLIKQILNDKINKSKKRKPLTQKIRQIIACFIPSRKLRRKIRKDCR